MSREVFFAEYFRKKPFVLRAATRDLLDPPLTVAEFDDIRRRMTRENPVQVVERPGEAWFVRVADLASPRLAELSDTIRRTLDWPNVWCDTVQTHEPSGIGCHFDDSDNFVLQQEGTKRWQLSPPSGLPEDSLRRRMTGDHSVGTAYMPEDALEFVLNPGDVLYLPVFWSHWGVSDGPSLSISLALNSANALGSVLPLIAKELATDRAWWEPMPADRGNLDALWETLADPGLRRRVETALLDRHRTWVADGLRAQRSDTAEPAAADLPDEAPGVVPAALSLSLGNGGLRELVHRPRQLPEAKDLLSMPTAVDIWSSARHLHTRHALVRVLQLLRHRSGHWKGQPEIQQTAQAVIDLLSAVDEWELADLGRHPVLLGAIRRAEHETAADYRETGDEFVAQVASALLGLAGRHPDMVDGRTFAVARSEQRRIVTLLSGERWAAPEDLAEVTAVRFGAQTGTAELMTADGAWHRPTVEPLPAVPGSSLYLLERHNWWDLANRRGVSWHCGQLPRAVPDLSSRAAEAVALLADRWPEALAAAEAHLLVLTQPGARDEWLCRPAKRGQVASPETMAVGLVTVLARIQWRIATDLFPAPAQELPPVQSPWDGSSRSAQWLCGQIFAARMQSELCRRLLEKGTDDVEAADAAMAAAEGAEAAVRSGLSGFAPGSGGWFEAFMMTQIAMEDGQSK
ncbi:JmjC domain-containing protein [Streptacidiphilus sp. EB103A]|uniref:JmjC domain-containing protein n=1 Tax=Streptacidiphilus sp. EB103A TaxID=3156275 RepID=UPI003510F623